MWILACVLLFGFTTPGIAAADVYESALIWEGDQVGSCVGALGRMDGAANDLELICGHDLADETVVVQVWKKSGNDFILVSYAGPQGNPFSLKATLSDADVDELELGNLYVAVSPTQRQESPVLGQIGQMDTGSTWAITEGEEDDALQARAGHRNGWCVATIGRLDERYGIGCLSPNNEDPGLIFVGSGVAFLLNGTTSYYRAVTADDLGEECDDEAVDWKEFLRDVRAGTGIVIAGDVTGTIPVPMIVRDFATFASGGGISSDVVLMNRHSTTALSGYWKIRDQNGSPTAQENFGPVPPLNTITNAGSSVGDTPVISTVTVKGDGPLGGLVRYNLPGNTNASVLPSIPASRVVAPLKNSAAGNTGVAIRNPESRDMTYSVRAIQNAADKSAVDDFAYEGKVTLPPSGQVSQFVTELVCQGDTACQTAMAEFEGTVVIVAENGAVEAVAFQVGPGFAVLPVGTVEGP